MAFDPIRQLLHCASCGTTRCPEAADRARPWSRPATIAEIPYRAGAVSGAALTRIDTSAISCPSCGAEHQVHGDTVASICPFCATPLVRASRHVHRHPAPTALLPFAVTEAEAHDAIAGAARTFGHATRGLRDFIARPPGLWGTYLSFYTFDGRVYGTYEAVSRSERDSGYVTGSAAVSLDDLLVSASDKAGITDTVAERTMPRWNPADLRPWRDEYLVGFHAALPSIGVDTARGAAERLFAAAFWRAAAEDAGLNKRITHIDFAVSDITWKPIMLPMWFGHYRCRGKDLYIAVNGHTGEAVIQHPGYGWKITLTVVLAMAAVMGYLYLKIV